MRAPRIVAEFAHDVARQYFAESRQPGESFWSGRELAGRFGVTQYFAEAAITYLVKKGVLERRHGRGTFLADRSPEALREFSLINLRLAIVLPQWQGAENSGLIEHLVKGLQTEGLRRGWSIIVHQKNGLWLNRLFPSELAAEDRNFVLALDPQPEGALGVAFDELYRAKIPILVLGGRSASVELLGIPNIVGKDEEAAHQVVSRWLSKGIRNIVLVGRIFKEPHSAPLAGLRSAFAERREELPEDFLVAEIDSERGMMLQLRRHLERAQPPQALLFNSYRLFLTALREIPRLGERIRAGVRVAALDERGMDPDAPSRKTGLSPRSGQIRIEALQFFPDEVLQKTIQRIEEISRGVKVPLSTLLTRRSVMVKCLV